MSRIVDVIISDETNAVSQKGFSSVVLLVLDDVVPATTINSLSEISGLGPEAEKEASAFFAGGGTELNIIGYNVEDAKGTTEENFKILFDSAINAFDFYGVIVSKGTVQLSDLQILTALQTLIEGNKRALFYEVDGSYSSSEDATGGDVTSPSRITSDRIVVYARNDSDSGGVASAVAGYGFREAPGSLAWGNNVIPSVSNSGFTLADEGKLKKIHVNYISNVLGLNVTQFGRTLSGKEFEDIRLEDAIAGAVEEQLTQLLINAKKISFTTPGLVQVYSVLTVVGQQYVNSGGLSSYVAFVPDIDDISATDIANHVLKNVKLTVVLAGSIETITVNVVVKLKKEVA